ITQATIRGSVLIHLGDPRDGPLIVLTHVPEGAAGDTAEPRVSERVVRIGRSPDNNVVLGDLLVSRRHAELQQRADGKWELTDLHSHNGTFVDGERIERAVVTATQSVSIGSSTFRAVDGVLREIELDERTPALEASDLFVFVRKGQAILDGVSFSLAPGELLAVVGPTGSGKSTLLKALTGFRPPDRGRVLYHG